MKRTRRWLLIFTALVGLMAHAGALRATSLLFGKQSTTTKATTTVSTTSTEASTEAETAAAELASADNDDSAKVLTGIPQIDYVWDPNLPRELNGYNLSDYPFFSNVPSEKEVGFKCDGLHDGFYASVKHKCQLYHHCIYGVRHDFLCANFTAFDQRTFICHFANTVDCKNSEKFWFRNDALYKATTTPSTTTIATAPPPTQPGRPFRRPLRRRRPSDYYYDEDYEDDYYEERVNRRQKQRPRQRRPEYDDEYEDDRYVKRPKNRERSRGDTNNRRPAAVDRPAERPIDRPVDRPRIRNRPGDSRRFNDDDTEDRAEPPRKPGKRRRPVDDLPEPIEDRKQGGGARRYSTDDRRPLKENRHQGKASEDTVKNDDIEDDRRPIGGGGRRRQQGGQRRPIVDDDIDERPARREEESEFEEKVEDKVEVVPTPRSGSGSLYARPRVPPRIPPPVPVNERKKFGYPTTKKSKSTTPASIYDDEYYDDYEDLAPLPPPRKAHKEDKFADSLPPQRESRRPLKNPVPIQEDPKTRYETVPSDLDIDDYEDIPSKNSRNKQSDRNNYKSNHSRGTAFKQDDDARTLDSPPLKSNRNNYYEREATSELDRPRYKDEPRDEIDEISREIRPVVRVVKRPFLPSRGGSPYLPRGLQPVGSAQKSPATESTPIDMGSTVSGVRLLEHGPPIVRSNTGPEDYPPARQGPRTTQQPQIDQQRSALDEIYDSEYDVTLNDALNPTLKPITRGLPSGFSHSNKFRLPATGSGPSAYQDSLYSSTDRRSSSVPVAAAQYNSRTSQSRQSQSYYDDYDY